MLSSLLKQTLLPNTGAEFYSGYLWAVKQEDKQPYIVDDCFKTDDDLNNMLGDIMADIKANKISDADKLWEKTESHFDASLKPCSKQDVYSEYQGLDKYAKDVLAKSDAKDFLTKRYKKYKAEIDQLSGEMLAAWDANEIFNAGWYDGQIAQRMGLAPGPYTFEEEADKEDQTAPAQFLAGWVYGLSGQTVELRDEIMKCFV